MFGGKMPDITPGQIAAVLTFVVTQLVAYGIVNNDQAQAVISAGGVIIPAVWTLADAWLRGARAKAHGMALAAGKTLDESVNRVTP